MGLKKLEKAFAAHCKAHEKEATRPAPAAAEGEARAPAPAPAIAAPAADGAAAAPAPALRVVAGTFGLRQAISIEASCGPFSHVFSF